MEFSLIRFVWIFKKLQAMSALSQEGRNKYHFRGFYLKIKIFTPVNFFLHNKKIERYISKRKCFIENFFMKKQKVVQFARLFLLSNLKYVHILMGSLYWFLYFFGICILHVLGSYKECKIIYKDILIACVCFGGGGGK